MTVSTKNRISVTSLVVTMTTVALILVLEVSWTKGQGNKFNAGTNYEVDEEDIVTYVQLGKSCDPAVQKDIERKTGICRATLYCNSEVNRCDCEDIGPYKYTEENGTCKAYVGSWCYSRSQCVANASCLHGKCVCEEHKTCATFHLPVRAL